MTDDERRARAEARRARGMVVEPITSLDEPDPSYLHATVQERLAAMTRLCRAAWLATGQPMPPSGREHRKNMPGEVYWPGYGTPRRSP